MVVDRMHSAFTLDAASDALGSLSDTLPGHPVVRGNLRHGRRALREDVPH